MATESGRLQGASGKNLAIEGLRGAILRGEMAPGQRLVEAELVETFHVTRGSVRGAIDDLAAEGLVERIHNRGARVRAVSLDEAISILECRRVLEGLIAARAAERVGPADIRDLGAIADALTNAVRDAELMKYSALNQELHGMLETISGQATAADLIRRLKAQIVRHQFQLSLRPGRPQVSLVEHIAIIDAVVSGNPDDAERAARAHLGSVIAALQSNG